MEVSSEPVLTHGDASLLAFWIEISFGIGLLLLFPFLFLLFLYCGYRFRSKCLQKARDDVENGIELPVIRHNRPYDPAPVLKPLGERVDEFTYDKAKYEVDPIDCHWNQESLGSGYFGTVTSGFYKGKSVAFKEASLGKEKAVKVLLDELTILSNIPEHPNIIKLIGAITESKSSEDKMRIILERCDSDLRQRLEKAKAAGTSSPNRKPGYRCAMNVDDRLSQSQLLSFAYQLAEGMHFFSHLPCLHRDLATKNLLVKKEDDISFIKIADFGLARRRAQLRDQYFSIAGYLNAYPWRSPETSRDHVFTVETDVWAYGVVLYEIFTLGDTPLSQFTQEDLDEEIYRTEGLNHITIPPGFPEKIFSLMKECWNIDPKKRPTFQECAEILGEELKRADPKLYARLQAVLHPSNPYESID